jgi:hypothetical protein
LGFLGDILWRPLNGKKSGRVHHTFQKDNVSKWVEAAITPPSEFLCDLIGRYHEQEEVQQRS